MSFKNLMFNPAFMRMQNQSSLISRMMGSSSKMGVMGSPQYMSKASMKAYSKIMAKQIQSYDSFSRTESASKTEDKAEYSRVAGQVNRAGGTNNYTPTPKATLADVTAAFDDARAANHAKLDNAGNEIIAVNDRTGCDLMYASTRINGARYDYQSTQYISGGAYLDKIDQNAFNRQMVNRQIGNILSEKGISVGEGEEYTFIAAVDPVAVFGGADADDVMTADVGDDPPELAVGVIDGEPFAELRAGIFGAVGSPGLLADRPAFLRKILLDCGLINARGFPPYDVQLVKDLIPAFAGSAGDGAYNAVIGDMTFRIFVAPEEGIRFRIPSHQALLLLGGGAVILFTHDVSTYS